MLWNLNIRNIRINIYKLIVKVLVIIKLKKIERTLIRFINKRRLISWSITLNWWNKITYVINKQ